MFACLESEKDRGRRQERNEVEEIKKRWHKKSRVTLTCCRVDITEALVEIQSDCWEETYTGSTKELHSSVLKGKVSQLIEAILDDLESVFFPRFFGEKPEMTHCLVFTFL